jgi:hypothetical protein
LPYLRRAQDSPQRINGSPVVARRWAALSFGGVRPRSSVEEQCSADRTRKYYDNAVIEM